MKFVVGHQEEPFETSIFSTTGLFIPAPILSTLPTSSDIKPFKFVLASTKTIAGWFGVTCQDCPTNSIWGCYITKSCWKVVIVAVGAIFLFIAFLMSLFFLGQIDDILKYQSQLTEWENAYPNLAKFMIAPLKLIHKSVVKTYGDMMKKFGSKPWFKFVILWPGTCLKVMWTMFQKILQPTCLLCCTMTSKTKKFIQDRGILDFILKKIGIRDDSVGNAKTKKLLDKKIKENEKQVKIDTKKTKQKAKRESTKVKEKSREDAKQTKIDAKIEKSDAKEVALEIKKEEKEEALKDIKEAKQGTKFIALETKKIGKKTKNALDENVAKRLNILEPPSPPLLPPPPPPSPIPPMAMVPPEVPSTLSIAPPSMTLTTPTNTISPLVPMAPLGVLIEPPTMLNQQPIFEDLRQQFAPSVYTNPIQQTITNPYVTTTLYGTTNQQYALNLYESSAQQHLIDPYVRYGFPTGQVQKQDYGAYNNPTYGGEQYGIYSNDPIYEQGGFGQNQYGAFGQFQEQGTLGQFQEHGIFGQTQYGTTIDFGYDSNTPNAPNVQTYNGREYYGQ